MCDISQTDTDKDRKSVLTDREKKAQYGRMSLLPCSGHIIGNNKEKIDCKIADNKVY